MESRWIWRLLALPGVAWLSLFFLVAFYAVVASRSATRTRSREPVPFWNPLDWNVGYVLEMLRNIWNGGQFLTVVRCARSRSSSIALALSLADRLPGRVLHGPARGPLEGARAARADRCRSGSTT